MVLLSLTAMPTGLVHARATKHERSASPEKLILTIDDGFQKQDEIVQLLDAHNAKATFFISGQALTAYPSAWQHAQTLGYAIGCHTMTHPAASKISEIVFRRELRDWRATAKRVLGQEASNTTLFRFPYGDTGGRHRAVFQKILEEEGFKSFLWDVDVSTPYTRLSPASRIKNATARLNESRVPNPIILAHFTAIDIPAIQDVLSWAEAKGIQVQGVEGLRPESYH